MAYIVLAVGAIMGLLGALAIVTGYPIIQIERGWATVIAGSTLLAGGFVTAALGLMLRALLDLKASLANGSVAGPGATASATQEAPHAEPAFHTERDHTLRYGTAALGAAAVAVPPATLATSPRYEQEAFHAHAEPVSLDLAPAPIEVEHDKQEPASAAHETASSPPIDDWLDKAFADLSLESAVSSKDIQHGPSTQVEPEPLHFEHTAPRRDGEIQHAEALETESQTSLPLEAQSEEIDIAQAGHEPEYHEPEHAIHAVHDEAAHVPSVEHDLEPMVKPASPASNEPAVIGRYEADGTAYTMYADGSIEAQSDAGIYRFASMADLKAFIES